MACGPIVISKVNREAKSCEFLLTLTFVLSPFILEMWNKTPSKSAILTSIDSGFNLKEIRDI